MTGVGDQGFLQLEINKTVLMMVTAVLRACFGSVCSSSRWTMGAAG